MRNVSERGSASIEEVGKVESSSQKGRASATCLWCSCECFRCCTMGLCGMGGLSKLEKRLGKGKR